MEKIAEALKEREQTRAWHALEKHARFLKTLPSSSFQNDSILKIKHIDFDYSHHLATNQTWSLLLNYAHSIHMQEYILYLFKNLKPEYIDKIHPDFFFTRK